MTDELISDSEKEDTMKRELSDNECEKCGLWFSRSTLKKCKTCEKRLCGCCSVPSIVLPGRFCGPGCLKKARVNAGVTK